MSNRRDGENKRWRKEAMAISITLNGEARDFATAMNLSTLLRELGLEPRKIAVERNLAIVPRSTFDEVIVDSGDRLEIVRFVGGG